MLELLAKIVSVLPIETGTSSKGEWKKARVVVQYDEKYPKTAMLQNMKLADEFSQLQVGTYVKFFIEPTSREFNGKWYSSIDCWKWEAGQQTVAQPIQTTGYAQQQPQQGYAPQPQMQQQGYAQPYQQPAPAPQPQGFAPQQGFAQQSDGDVPF